MTHKTITTTVQECDHARVLCSPVALAFVRIVVARRGVSEARAREIFLDYLDRAHSRAAARDGPGSLVEHRETGQFSGADR